jgi:hypothetical protein
LLWFTPARPASVFPPGATMATASDSKKFNQMGVFEKIVFIGKFILFVASFGFAFPLLLND